MIIYILFLKCTLMCDVDSSDHKAHFAKKRDENAFSTVRRREWHLELGNQQEWQPRPCNIGESRVFVTPT